MLEKINIKSILYSFLIGAVIGVCSQTVLGKFTDILYVLANICVSGVIGLFIGAVIELILVFLPINKVKVRTYFFVSNLIALFITSIVIMAPYFFAPRYFTFDIIKKVLGIAFIIIILANVSDYYRFKRANRKLMDYKEKKDHSDGADAK